MDIREIAVSLMTGKQFRFATNHCKAAKMAVDYAIAFRDLWSEVHDEPHAQEAMAAAIREVDLDFQSLVWSLRDKQQVVRMAYQKATGVITDVDAALASLSEQPAVEGQPQVADPGEPAPVDTPTDTKPAEPPAAPVAATKQQKPATAPEKSGENLTTQQFEECKLTELKISNKARNLLGRAGLTTVGQVVDYLDSRELTTISGVDEKLAKHVIGAIEELRGRVHSPEPKS